ncbi:MAG: hypothetical protein QW083_00470 [Methanomassiliicoccales archaeon]
MHLTLRVIQQEGQESGIIEIRKRMTLSCSEKIGEIVFSSDEEKSFLLDLLSKGGLHADIFEMKIKSKC